MFYKSYSYSLHLLEVGEGDNASSFESDSSFIGDHRPVVVIDQTRTATPVRQIMLGLNDSISSMATSPLTRRESLLEKPRYEVQDISISEQLKQLKAQQLQQSQLMELQQQQLQLQNTRMEAQSVQLQDLLRLLNQQHQSTNNTSSAPHQHPPPITPAFDLSAVNATTQATFGLPHHLAVNQQAASATATQPTIANSLLAAVPPQHGHYPLSMLPPPTAGLPSYSQPLGSMSDVGLLAYMQANNNNNNNNMLAYVSSLLVGQKRN